MEFDIDFDGLSPWVFGLALAIAIAISYPVGYVFIDVVKWVKIPLELQEAPGAIHVMRSFLGAIVISAIFGVFMLWDLRKRGSN